MSEGRPFPARPTVPVSLHLLLAALAAERSCLWLGTVPWQTMAVPAALAAVCLGRRWARRDAALPTWEFSVAACALACCLALAVTGATLGSGRALERALARSPVSSWAFEVVSEPVAGRYGERCRATARRDGTASGDVWLVGTEGLGCGDVVQVVGRWRPNADDEWGRTSRSQGVWGSVSVVRVLGRGRLGGVRGLLHAVRAAGVGIVVPTASDERAALAGCILAERRAMELRGIDRTFSSCGVAHLVAVSGSHLSVVAGMISAALERSGLRPFRRVLVLALVTGLFVLVCGSPPSAVRAWGMALVGFGSTLAGRRPDGVSATCLVALSMALVDPALVGQLSFLLSLTCVLGLGLFRAYAAYVLDLLVPQVGLPRSVPARARILLRRARRKAVGSLAASLVAQGVSIPLVCPLFSQLAPIGPLASLVVTAPLSLSMASGLLALCLWWAPVPSRLLLAMADLLMGVVLALLRTLASLPFATLPASPDGTRAAVATVVAGAALLVAWPRPSPRPLRRCAAAAAAALLCLFLRWRLFAPARIVVLDVGQGDAILVQEGPSAILVDTGPDASTKAALARNHVLHLDAVVLTHLHDDHVGGLDDLVGALGCDRVVVAQGVASALPEDLAACVEELTGARAQEIGHGGALRVGSFVLEDVWPRGRVDGSGNQDSLELLVSYERGGRRLTALLSGDAERDETGRVIEEGAVSRIDLLKVGHHGSEVSLTPEEAAVLSPVVAVASAGEGNAHGHPSEACANMLEGVGARFLCTKDVGDVEVRPAADGIAVRAEGAVMVR